MTYIIRFGCVLALLALGAGVAEAGGERRVAVLDIVGDDDNRIRDLLTDRLAETYRIVPGRDYGKTATKLGARSLEPKDVAEVAAALELDAVMSAEVRRRKKRYELSIKVFEGASGELVKKLSVELKKKKLSSKLSERLTGRVVAVIDAIPRAAGKASRKGKAAEVAAAGGERGERAGLSGDDEVKAALRVRGDDGEVSRSGRSRRGGGGGAAGEAAVRRGTDEEGASDGATRRRAADDDDGDDDDDESTGAIASSAGKGAAGPRLYGPRFGSLNVGASFISRRLSYNARAFDEAPLRHDGVMAAGLAARLELMPLASRTGALRRISIGAELDLAVSFNTAVGEVLLPTTQRRFLGVLRYAQPVGKSGTAPVIRFEFAAGRADSTLDTRALPSGMTVDVPDVEYLLIAAGLGFRVPLGARAALDATVRGMTALDAGPIANLDQYGPGKVTGIDGEAALEIYASRSLLFRASVLYTAIGLDFQGAGDLANARDGDPSTVDVGGALDRYAGARVAIGYVF